ncbi:hypothetical protein GCM10009415_45490 [Chitinophaga japonensis]
MAGGWPLALLLAMSSHLFAQSAQIKINQLIREKGEDTAAVRALMQLGEAYLDRPESLEADMMAAFAVAARMESLSGQLHYQRGLGLSRLLQAKAFRESGHADRGRQASGEAVQLLTAHGTPAERAQAILELGGTYSIEPPDISRKIQLYEQGADIYMRAGNELTAAQLKEFIGDLLQVNQQYDRSLQVLQECLAIYRKTGYERLHGVYSIMAEAYHGKNNFVESLRYNLLAVETGEKLEEKGPLMATIYNRVGLNYYSVKYFDQAIDYFNKGLAQARAGNDSASAKTLLLNIADALRNKGAYRASLDSLARAADYGHSDRKDERAQIEVAHLKNYVELHAPGKAKVYYGHLLQLYREPGGSATTNQYLRMAIAYYLQSTGAFAETVPFLAAFEKQKEKTHLSLVKRAEGEYLAYRTDSALGDLNAAIRHLLLYKKLSDSLTSTNQARQLGLLRLQFETERKDQDIRLLTQKSQLQEASLQKEKVYRNVFIAGVCMLLIFLAMLYNRYRLKQQVTARMELQQREINSRNEALKKLVDEKEWLLKEIHHRVKNNLQIVISLLNTQSEYLDNTDAIMALRNSQRRMYAMSLIHQRLYQAETLGEIDMNWYIDELIRYMKECFDTGGRITFEVDYDKISLDVVQAVPLGLVLNEAVSNSIKYAFPGNRKGKIRIRFKRVDDYHCSLAISDNGVGFGDHAAPEGTASLGMSLMRGLADQLGADYEMESSNAGVAVTIRFQSRSFSGEALNYN